MDFFEVRQQIIQRDFARMNDRQFEAVTTVNGPLLVLAGAGSGKTTVIIHRIANLVKYGNAYHENGVSRRPTEEDLVNMQRLANGDKSVLPMVEDLLSWRRVKPWQILAITFTNKAAGELKERLKKMLGEEDGSAVWAMTFHAFCGRVLRRDGDKLGFSSHFTIYDTDDAKRVMKEVQRLLQIDEKFLPVKVLLSTVSRAKESLQSPEEMAAESGKDIRMAKIAQAYATYESMLQKADAMDFDDLIVNAIRLFQRYPEVLAYYNDRFSYVMVDEYQDTNHAQYVLTRLLAGNRANLCAVGDDDQSIYRFRGATIENILSFEKTFPNARVIRLEQNYRSTQNILDAANAVIQNNKGRKGKNLWTSKGAGQRIKAYTSSSDLSEASYIANSITDSAASGAKWSDHAVLYRVNALSNNIENALIRAGIPYRIIGGHRFYERKEIRDAIAYLSLVANPDDAVRLQRIINEPKRGIGQTSLNNAAQIAAGLGISLFQVIENASDYPAIKRAAPKFEAFAAMIRRFSALSETLPPAELFVQIMDESGYRASLALEPEKAEERGANLDELQANLLRFREENPEGSLNDFLEEVSLLSDIDNYNADSDAVVLMTIHSAKGLEFPIVYLPGLEENIFPGARSLYDPEEIEEERRLMYVAITRAREKLYLLNSSRRLLHGNTVYNPLSRFVREIPEELMDIEKEGSVFLGSDFGKSYGGREQSIDRTKHTPQKEKSSHTEERAFFGESALLGGNTEKKPKSGSMDFHAGDTVRHKKFGEGMILKAERLGNDMLLEIAFETTGTKKLMANHARLEKL